MLKLFIALLCVACAAATQEVSDLSDVDPRWLFFNNTDDDAAVTTAVLSVIGFVVALVALGVLLWLALSLFAPTDEYGTGYGTGYATGYNSGSSGYQAR